MAIDLFGSAMNSVTDTSAAAPPPTPLKMATICGMAVIFTVRAAGTPMSGADHDGDDDEEQIAVVAVDRRERERPRHGDDHPGRAGQVAETGALGRAQPLQGQDEADDGDEIDEVGGGGAAHDFGPSASLALAS